MFKLTVDDGMTACCGCDKYIDTETETFIALIAPDHSLESFLDGERDGRPSDWTYWRGVNTYHVRCWDDRDRNEALFMVTGAGRSTG